MKGLVYVIAVFYFLEVLFTCTCVEAQSCGIITNNPGGPPILQSYGKLGKQITRQHQAIFTSYKFNCCGSIRKWEADVHYGGNDRQNQYTIDFQVWRQSPSSPECYSLVGNNRFADIILNPVKGTVELTPSFCAQIQFQPGDVLGIYVERARYNTDGVVVLTDALYANETVWQGFIPSPIHYTLMSSDCLYKVGAKGDLDTLIQGAPVVSVSIREQECVNPTEEQFSTSPTERIQDESNHNNLLMLVAVSASISLGFIILIFLVVTVVLSLVVYILYKKIKTVSARNTIDEAYYSYPRKELASVCNPAIQENIAYM